ncbi:family 20 glycosylhydrolase [Actinomadura opuntiae]|uniref:family 20 glycosylhydrolase n=1 Tax=Actinomadura sp. OS1-43 TaxID=604315 RepID=UPI00255B3481|nr:family 20 glycosylhydrolase [Actinomadura sp. OS1-43]MDL4817655.1 family 20 glycosylhydrolase [Actinomadura sp. OS1-43]
MIPAPVRQTAAEGVCRTDRPWHVRADDPSLDETAHVLAPHLRGGAGAGEIVLALGDVPLEPGAIGVQPSGDSDECYRLTVEPDRITCTARTPQGIARAAAGVLQILAETPETPCRVIDDAPRYAWRGLMVDPARHFIAPDDLRRLIDLAALYKLNVLHLHLTDNEGWRLHIATRPALTAGTPHYSAAEYAALQEYAAARHVTVVPEIDLPGHSAAALRAYPDLGTLPRPSWYPADAPFPAPLDPNDPHTRAFIVDVLAETARLTSGPFVHFGGDEALGADEASFTEAVRLAREALRVAGKRPIGWQESSRAGIEPGDLAQFWVDVPMMDLPQTQEELDERPELLAAGHTLARTRALTKFFAPTNDDLDRIVRGGGRVLLSPQSHLYLDRPYDPSIVPPDQAEFAARLGFAYRPRDIRHAASWDPSAYDLAPDQIMGVEATLFAEDFQGFADHTALLLPRLPGVAEAAWSPSPPSWDDYRDRLAVQSVLWRARGLTALRSTEIDWR